MYGLRHGNFGRRKHIWSGFFDDVRVARLACSKACVSGSERIQLVRKGYTDAINNDASSLHRRDHY